MAAKERIAVDIGVDGEGERAAAQFELTSLAYAGGPGPGAAEHAEEGKVLGCGIGGIFAAQRPDAVGLVKRIGE